MRVHFIALGGSAMHNLALALHQKGDVVTGSDDAFFEPSKSRLQAHNLLPETEGWDPNRISTQLDAIILGMHAKADNPELLRAQALNIPIYSYPEFLFAQAQDKTRVVVAGSHGKTTITSMVLHVMHYHERDLDFMVGAQLEGFDTMVSLKPENDFMVLEGDEYLSSALDLRPKFHWYKPNIALISGIAWDHINVFPSFENYVSQFSTFINTITPGGTLVYNQEDEVLHNLVQESTHPIKKCPYKMPKHQVENGQTFLDTPEGLVPIQVFGTHNLLNLEGAKWLCQLMGIDALDFYEAISTFKGAQKRLELLAEGNTAIAYKDFAHAPSKVRAVTASFCNQFELKHVLACLELHTYSSLNPTFIKEYAKALHEADEAVVFYSPKAVALKGLKPLEETQIQEAFARPDLKVFTNATAFEAFLHKKELQNTAVLLMSSGNYGGLNWSALKDKIKAS